MITIDRDAAEYIRKRSCSVFIELRLEPALGGCACAPQRITGSYVPAIYMNKPLNAAQDKYSVVEVDEIKVYHPATLGVKEGFTKIRIKLKKILFWGWLELEGAKAVAIYE